MIKIKFLTDTASDLPGYYKEAFDMEMMSIPIVVDGEDYINEQNDDVKAFYPVLRSAKSIPATSQITTYKFVQQYKKLYDQGYTHIIGLFIPSFASGTYENANMAVEQLKEEYPETKDLTIFIPDTKTYSLGYGLCLVEAAKYHQQGADFQQVVSYIKKWISEIEIYFSMYSLEFARKSGRLGGVSALIGDVLGIKPILCVKDGKLSIYKKVRGKKALIKELYKIADERMKDGSEYAVLQGETEKEAAELHKLLQEKTGYTSYGVFYSGPAVTINSGPEIVGVGFRSNKE